MHEYTAWQVHEDRMREFTREADAAPARGNRPGRGKRGRVHARFFGAGCRSAWLTFPSRPGDRRHPTTAEPLEPARIVAG